jgi:hypothetical protein
MDIDISKYYTEEVKIYEQIKKLNEECDQLADMWYFIDGNYDSKISAKIEASSFHNFNNKNFKSIELPINVILETPITKTYVLDQISKRMAFIKHELRILNDKFENLNKK